MDSLIRCRRPLRLGVAARAIVLCVPVALGAATLVAAPALAQEDPHLRTDVGIKDYRWELGVVGGGQYYAKDHGLGRADIDEENLSPQHSPVFGLQLTFNLSRYVAFEVEGLGTRTAHPQRSDRHVDLPAGWAGAVPARARAWFAPTCCWVAWPCRPSSPTRRSCPTISTAWAARPSGSSLPSAAGSTCALEGRVQSSLAFASEAFSWGNETHYGGPDFLRA